MAIVWLWPIGIVFLITSGVRSALNGLTTKDVAILAVGAALILLGALFQWVIDRIEKNKEGKLK